ncbi:MAG TPA: hypothetical protein PLC15_15175 [Candidatus Obscuribacter sp.]|nr:hypothetical protein [Candidatus Obscuribacter sp.]HMX46286.1 hypothetical protein [Candidatus Obscuribacter sp.]HMY01947.1 hypothetical protein [Candidatus Obscuribacter sp.]HNB16724.1 hypothetical protein [Candidatus Obscuribacter sp.]HND07317.1 hypothetical protein [Candidatus Obscuribacter sp.]
MNTEKHIPASLAYGALFAAYNLLTREPERNHIRNYYGSHRVYSEKLLDVVCRILREPTGWTEVLKVRLTNADFIGCKGSFDESTLTGAAAELITLGGVLGFDVRLRSANNGKTTREGYGRTDGTWDYPLEFLPGYEEWCEIAMVKSARPSISGEARDRFVSASEYTAVAVARDALSLAASICKGDSWNLIHMVESLPFSFKSFDEVRHQLEIDDLEQFGSLVKRILSAPESFNCQSLNIRLTGGDFASGVASVNESELSGTAAKILQLGEALGFRAYLSCQDNGAYTRKGYGRCEGVWDYPRDLLPEYEEWIQLVIR